MSRRPDDLLPAERLVMFTDAVVAIAMTLLILPLLELVPEAASEHLSTADYLREHDGQLFAFALSFVLIGRFWQAHARLFRDLDHYDAALLWLNTGWMFTIVFLPVVTAMVGAMDTDRLQLALYIGTLLAASVFLLAIHLRLLHRPDLLGPDGPSTLTALTGRGFATGLFALALVLAVAIPGVGYYSLLVLLLDPVLARVLARRRVAG